MRAVLATLLLFVCACATHREQEASIVAQERREIVEPVAVPERIEIEAWGTPAPLTITPGIGRLLPIGPQAVPLPAVPKATHGADPDALDPFLEERTHPEGEHWKATIFYGEPGEKKTIEGATLAAESASSGGMKPSLFGLGVGWWIGIALAVAGVVLALFRKSLPFKLPFLS